MDLIFILLQNTPVFYDENFKFAKYRENMAAPAADPSIYLTLGHGDDDIDVDFESRMKVPAGITLVTLAECGVVTKSSSVHPIMDAFCDPSMKEILQNPIVYKKKISDLIGGVKLNIYEPGDSMPDLGLHLFLEWIEKPSPSETAVKKTTSNAAASGGAGAGGAPLPGPLPGLILPGLMPSKVAPVATVPKVEPKMRVQRSGVYKFPVHGCFNMRSPENDTMKDRSLKYKYVSINWNLYQEPTRFKNENEILEMYKDSVFPTVSEMTTILHETGMDFKKVKKATYFKLSDVFDKLKEGVYYFVVCRSVRDKTETNIGNFTRKVMKHSKENPANYMPKLSNEEYNEFTRLKNAYSTATNKIKYYPSIFPYVLAGSEGIRSSKKEENFTKRPLWNSAYMNDPRFLKRQYRTVTRTRRKSISQQSKYKNDEVEANDAVGGAGGPPLLKNFPPLTADSSLEEVLSELPHLEMKGVDDEKMLHEYNSMIERYPHYKNAIILDLIRVLMKTMPTPTRLRGMSAAERNAFLDTRLAEIKRVYAEYPNLIEHLENRINILKSMRGGRRTRRRRA